DLPPPAHSRAAPDVAGELPAPLKRLTVTRHSEGRGRSVNRASEAKADVRTPPLLPVSVEPGGTGAPAAGGSQRTTTVLLPLRSSRWKVRLRGAAGDAVTIASTWYGQP